ncbi:thiamine pyrophosphate-binding protein [Rhizohabitans arisaemae]|uniref:thiamine pyrophosphate-binding protein n=1 Tax=Rhizohabitans arisaemae TaxID=2720610 RepID=UPI0024B08B48|nr:thiamine pyrophosphate-binding protein [Rhizohabitans arisaemae]
MRGFELLAAALAEEGVDTVFAVMGDGNLHLLAELSSKHAIRIVHARHEQGAVAMADGYSRLTGRLGVATVTHGPGLTNTATSLATAAAHGSKVLLIAGGLAAGDVHNLQRLDQVAFCQVLGARVVALTTSERAGLDVAEALRLCATERTVVLHAPTDVQLGDCAGARTPGRPDPRPMAADPAAVETVAGFLAEASQPVLLAGRGASGDEAIAEIVALAEHLDAPIVTSLLGKGNFAGHPRYLGVTGGLGDTRATAALAAADCVVAFGAQLNDWTTTKADFRDDAVLIHVDTRVEALGRFVRPRLAVLGDGAVTARQLRAACAPAEPRKYWPGEPSADSPVVVFDDGVGTVDPRRACAAVDEALPADAAVVVDGGHVCIWAAQLIGPRVPRSFTHGFSFGSIAQSLPLALGAAVGLNGRRVVAVMGDGAAAMSIHELETAVRTRAPLSVVVLNDAGFGIERHTLAAEGLPVDESNYPSPAFAEMARAMGVRALHVVDVAGLARIPEFLSGEGPTLIDIAVNGDLVSDTFREIKQLLPRE